MDGWNLAAQRFLTEARGEERAGHWQEAAVARINAAMCFHIAHLVTDTDPRTLRTLRASSVTTFAQAVPRLMPDGAQISLRWRTRTLPAYSPCRRPARARFRFWCCSTAPQPARRSCCFGRPRLLAGGIAVMTVDWPGTGESASFHIADGR